MPDTKNAFVEFLKDRRLSQKAYSVLTSLPLALVKDFYQRDSISEDTMKNLETLYYENLSLHGKSHYRKTIIITVTVDKGGAGKTTSAVNLCYSLARCGYEVLYVDFDGQQNGSISVLGKETVMRLTPKPPKRAGILEMILEEKDAREYITPSPYKHLDAICGAVGTSVISDYLAVRKHLQEAAKRDGVKQDKNSKLYEDNNLILRKCLKGVVEEGYNNKFYDFIIIDTPPAINNPNTVKMVCAASDKLLITTKLSAYDVQNIPSLLDFIKDIETQFGTSLLGILCTDVDKRYNTSKQLRFFLESKYADNIFKTEISHDAKVGDSQIHQMPIAELDRNAMSAKQYAAVATEILERCRYLEISDPEDPDSEEQ